MITPDMIPDEVVEAAARALAADANLHWDDIPYGHTILRNEAIAAIAAALNAWPGMVGTWNALDNKMWLTLPLPQENTNAEG